MYNSLQGNLFIKPLQANLTHNTDWILKMSPYVIFRLGGVQVKSNKAYGGGKNPVWGQMLELPKPAGDDILHVELWDNELFYDEHIGHCQVPLAQICQLGHVDQTYELFWKNQMAGTIFLDITFQPTGGMGMGMGGIGMGMGLGQYMQQPQQQFLGQPTYQKPIATVQETIQETIYQQQPMYQQQSGFMQPTLLQQQPGFIQPSLLQQQPGFQQGYPQQQFGQYPQQGGQFGQQYPY